MRRVKKLVETSPGKRDALRTVLIAGLAGAIAVTPVIVNILARHSVHRKRNARVVYLRIKEL